ncbi:MAG TPA: hypothetical protein VM597_29975 [Gemmataceae bacterium]|nr:hypothetical protein [Gemmataceae bacterium]
MRTRRACGTGDRFRRQAEGLLTAVPPHESINGTPSAGFREEHEKD